MTTASHKNQHYVIVFLFCIIGTAISSCDGHYFDQTLNRRQKVMERLKELEKEAKMDAQPDGALREIAKLLKDSDRVNRVNAEATIGLIGPKAAPLVPQLIDALSDPEQSIRREAITALGAIGPAAKAAIPQFILALKEQNTDCAWFAAEAIGKMGNAATNTIDVLEEYQNTPDDILRFHVREALQKIKAAQNQ